MRLCLPVGSYMVLEGTPPDGSTSPVKKRKKVQYREIGVVMEFERQDGSTWQEVVLNAEILQPSLFHLAKQEAEKGSGSVRVKMFPHTRKPAASIAPGEPGEPEYEDEGIPF